MLKPVYTKDESEEFAKHPETIQALYTDTTDGGKAFNGVEGHGVDNIAKLEKSLKDEREAHKTTKTNSGTSNEELNQWKSLGIPFDEAKERVEGYDALAAGNKSDTEAFNKAVEAKVGLTAAKHKHEVEALTKERDEFKTKWEEGQVAVKQNTVHGAVEAGMLKHNVAAENQPLVKGLFNNAFDLDANNEPISKEGFGIKGGQTIDQAFESLKKDNPGIFGKDSGPTLNGNTKDSGNSEGNPWSAEYWNLTKQIEYETKHTKEGAIKAAREAGSYYGASEPPPRKS